MEPLPGEFPIQRWEFNCLLLESVFFGGAAMGGLIGLGHTLGVPNWILFPLGFALVFLSQIPLNSVFARTMHHRKFSVREAMEACLMAIVVGGLISWFWRP